MIFNQYFLTYLKKLSNNEIKLRFLGVVLRSSQLYNKLDTHIFHVI